MLNHFWALPAALQVALVLAAQSTFSVSDDLLAYPQFKVQWLDDYVTDAFADTKLRRIRDRTASGPGQSHIARYEPPIHNDGRSSFDNTDERERDEHDYELMVIHKQRYLCTIPKIDSDSDDTGAAHNETRLAQQREEEAKELERANERGWELLQGMQGHCVYYISGWWSYSFCFEQGVRQFHAIAPSRGIPVYPPQEDTLVPGFMLGVYDQTSAGASSGETSVVTTANSARYEDAAASRELVAKGDSRYLVQRLEGGTTCDLTGKSRRVEIQYHCNPSVGVDRISLIKEMSTCAYLMVIQTPRLCNDVAFLPPQEDVPNDIVCRPVLKQDEVDDYLQELADLKEALEQRDKTDTSTENLKALLDDQGEAALTVEQLAELLATEVSTMQVVGDVIVGGHSIVPEDMVLEKSAIVGGGKEKYVDTVADSDGKTISKAEMEKLGYGDPRSVNKLAKEMEQRAQGQPWKLDIVDTPRGREYRGYINDKKEKETNGESEESKDKSSDNTNNEQEEGSKEEYFFKEEL